MARTRLTPIQEYNPVKFSVYRNASYSTVATTATRVPFDTKNFDTGSNVDIVTNIGRFTATVPGFYQFNWSVNQNTNSSRLFSSLYKNGVEIARGGDTATAQLGSAGAAFIQLAATDFVEIFYYDATAGNNLAGAFTVFSGFLESAT